MAITWRNVDGGQGALAAGRLMQGAEQSFNSGFSGLQDVLKQYQGQEKANWDAGKEQNTQAFLDRLSQVRTPEEMAALQASGELDRLKAGFGAQIDRSAVRNALDTRGDFLRQQATNRMTYDNLAQDSADAPILNALLARARGIDMADPKQVEQQLNLIEGEMGQSGLSARGQASLAQDLVNIRSSLLGDYQTAQSINNDAARLSMQTREANQRMDYASEERGWKLEERAANVAATQALNGATDLASARDRYMQSTKDLPMPVREQGLKTLTSMYTDTTGITEEQEKTISEMPDIQDLTKKLNSAKQAQDGFKIFTQAIEENVSEPAAVKELIERTDLQDDAAVQLQSQLGDLRKDLGIPDDFNLGPVVRAAGQRLGTDKSLLLRNKHFDNSDVKKALEDSYMEFVRYRTNQDKVEEAQRNYDSEYEKMKLRYTLRNLRNSQ